MQYLKNTTVYLFILFLLTSVLAAATIISEFHIKTIDNNVRLDWKTQQESNLKEFRIKRSSDQQIWTVIGTVKAITDGQSSHSYSFTDNRVFKGETSSLYYKLIMVDSQGRMTEHDTIASTAGISGIRHTWGSLKAMFR